MEEKIWKPSRDREQQSVRRGAARGGGQHSPGKTLPAQQQDLPGSTAAGGVTQGEGEAEGGRCYV